MNIETINENLNSIKQLNREKKIKVVEGDILVPDIKPDILSLINVDNDVYITKQEIDIGKINIEGVMEICALYISEDSNGMVKSLNNAFNFYETFNIDEVDENSLVNLKLYKGPVECKVVNARKINVKSPITIDISASNKESHSIAKDVVDDRNIEFQKRKMNIKMLCECKKQEVELRENVSLNEGSLPISEILKATMKIVNEDYKISYNKILAKADALIKIIYVADNETNSIECFETAIPVMGFIDYDGIDETMNVKLEYNVKSFLLKPIYQDLKSLSFAIDSSIEIKACTYRNENIELILDIYCPDYEIKCDYDKFQVRQSWIDEQEEVEMMQGLLIPDLDDIKILNIEATPNISNKNILDGKIALEGNINFDILFYNEKKKILENKKMELPFQQVIKIPNLQSGMETEVRIKIIGIDYQRIDSSQMQIKLRANISVCVEREENINGIKSIEMIEGNVEEMPSIIIYYVKSGDTLWNIAKRFKTTVKEIMDNNELKDDKIYPNEQLIITRRNRRTVTELL